MPIARGEKNNPDLGPGPDTPVRPWARAPAPGNEGGRPRPPPCPGAPTRGPPFSTAPTAVLKRALSTPGAERLSTVVGDPAAKIKTKKPKAKKASNLTEIPEQRGIRVT